MKKRIQVTTAFILLAGLLVSCAHQEDLAPAPEEAGIAVFNVEETEAARLFEEEDEFCVSAVFEGDKIVLSEPSGGNILNEIQIPYDQYEVFISMLDEKNGYLLYCSTPACGLMEKVLYKTEDRWKTYGETDIGSKIDGYPTSLLAVKGELIYVGTQMRSNGYLFVTKDGGKNWDSVSVEEDRNFRTGYAPILDKDSETAYAFFDTGDSNWLLYRAECPQAGEDLQNLIWEKAGKFSWKEDLMEDYFLYEGMIYLTDSKGKCYLLKKPETGR